MLRFLNARDQLYFEGNVGVQYLRVLSTFSNHSDLYLYLQHFMCSTPGVLR